MNRSALAVGQGFAVSSKFLGTEGCTVVSQQAFDANAKPRLVRHRVLHKRDGFVHLLIAIHGGVHLEEPASGT